MLTISHLLSSPIFGCLALTAALMTACHDKVPQPTTVMVDAAPTPVTPPPLWANLFSVGATSTWHTWELTKTHRDNAKGRASSNKENHRSGPTTTCNITSVEGLPNGHLRSTIICASFYRSNDLDPRPDGKWETDGDRLWQHEGNFTGLVLESRPGTAPTPGPNTTLTGSTANDGWCINPEHPSPRSVRACFHPTRGAILFAMATAEEDGASETYMVLAKPEPSR